MVGIGLPELLIILLVVLLLAGGVVLVILWFVAKRVLPKNTGAGGLSENALEILKARYARGELSREQYLDMRRDLEK
jgi:putative membrane protein